YVQYVCKYIVCTCTHSLSLDWENIQNTCTITMRSTFDLYGFYRIIQDIQYISPYTG
uniref:Uncharacterized protein n=1 Tax=Amphimedon queenslandica TaxID=400682 RepID=A0A1X7T686_AMPQE